jgi:predicted phosphate transport protein (TIGR00153 family)
MARFRFRLIPKDESFFDLFVQLATHMEEAASLYGSMVTEFDDTPARAARIHEIENEGDAITHEVMTRLNTVFVTPLDHEDIHRLVSRLDDVLDNIDASADLMVLHRIEQPLPEMKAQADVLYRAATAVREAVATLPKYKRLGDYFLKIQALEDEGDRIYRRAVADLFSGDHRAMDVLKWKDIIDETEAAIDGLQNVGNILEAIALKQS